MRAGDKQKKEEERKTERNLSKVRRIEALYMKKKVKRPWE